MTTRTIASTRVYSLGDCADWSAALHDAASSLRRGELVAFPTETVYGLGANALDPEAVSRIFAAKGRPQDNPLIVHVPDVDSIAPLTSGPMPPALNLLAERFWPGPLTMILPRSPLVPDVTTAGLDTVAIRVPSHPVAAALLKEAQVPVAAPSANRSGRPSPTQAEHVLEDLAGQVAVVLDGGPTGVGVESTVLDLTSDVPTVLRPGGVTPKQIAAVIGRVEVDPRATALPSAAVSSGPVRSPGMKYRHYAPQAPALLVEGDPPAVWRTLAAHLATASGRRPGVMATDEGLAWLREHGLPNGAVVESLGPRSAPEVAAQRLFAALRRFDAAAVDCIYIEGIPAEGVGLAVMNRLRRAAGGRVVRAEDGK